MAVRNVTIDNTTTLEEFVQSYNLTGADVGDIATLDTTATNLTDAVNEVHGDHDALDTRVGALNLINAAVRGTTVTQSINNVYDRFNPWTGYGTVLNTSATNLATAINEVHGDHDALVALVGSLSLINAAVRGSTVTQSINNVYDRFNPWTGYGTVLNTSATNLAASINEVHGDHDALDARVGALTNIHVNVRGTTVTQSIDNVYDRFNPWTGYGTTLATTATNLAAAINEVHGERDTLAGQVGSVATLATAAGTVVAAINEVHGERDTLAGQVGNIGSLNTTANIVVDAINEVHGERDALSNFVGALTLINANVRGTTVTQSIDNVYDRFNPWTGYGTTLSTTATNLAAAINEVHSERDTLAGQVGNIGSLATTATNVVSAINEVHGERDSLAGIVGSLANLDPNFVGVHDDNIVAAINYVLQLQTGETVQYTNISATGTLSVGSNTAVDGNLTVLGNMTSKGITDNATATRLIVGTNLVEATTNFRTTGNLTVNGNNVTSGSTTTNQLHINSGYITLLYGHTGAPSSNAHLYVERGTSPNTAIRWNEASDRWDLTTDGTNYYEILTTNSVATDSGKLNNKVSNTASVANTIVARDGSGNIFFRDATASRGNGQGYIYLGGASRYIGYNGSGYVLNGAGLTINGSAAWTAGNDGAGTGLDADLLDGQHGSYYRAWANITGKPSTFAPSAHTHAWADITGKPTTFTPSSHTHAIANITNLQTTLDGLRGDIDGNTSGLATKLSSSAYTAADVLAKLLTVDGANTNLDADKLDGQHGSYYRAWANLTGKPSTFTPSSHSHAISDITSLQTTLNNKLNASSYTAADVLAKLKTVDGALSGIDADLVRGVSGDDLVQTGGDGTAFPVGDYIGLNAYYSSGWKAKVTQNGAFVFRNGNDNIGLELYVQDGAVTQGADFSFDTYTWRNGDFYSGSNKFWHAGNDGPGSGLDADTLDGYHASALAILSNVNTFTNTMNFMSGGVNSHIGLGANQDVYLSTNTNGAIYTRILNSGSSYTTLTVTSNAAFTYKGHTIWHAGNDGSGTGLDADLLDGQHGGFYRNAGNLNAGTIPSARLSGTYGISVSGNAATATTLQTARTISLAGDVTGSASFNGSANVSITATIADDSHNHTIANVDGLQTALNAKADTSTLTQYGKTSNSNIWTQQQTFRGHIKLDDYDYIRMGTGTDVEIYFSGTNLYTDINNGGNIYYRDGNSNNATRFTFDIDTGNFTTSGNVTAYSDIRLKEHLRHIANWRTILDNIVPVYFDWNSKALDIGIKKKSDIGIIAQEVEEVLPEAVTEDREGYKQVDYTKLVPVLIEAIKELTEKVNLLEAR